MATTRKKTDNTATTITKVADKTESKQKSTYKPKAVSVEEKVDDMAGVEKKADEKVETKMSLPVKEKKKFSDSDGILCRSITQGGLYMEGAKTHMLYEWVEYGDITYVEYADLAAAVRVKSSYVFNPMFIVDDEDFIEEFSQLKKFYTENYTAHDLESILFLPVDEMLVEIAALPKSAIESLKVLAASSINDGTLDSVKKIKSLDEVFGTNLSILAEFKD